MRQLDIELVTIGPSHAERLRTMWLEMLARSPGVFHEPLDEAMALGTYEWRERAARLTSCTATSIAAVRDGSFIGVISGYVDQARGDLEGQISHFHVVSGLPGVRPIHGRVASMLLQALAEWLVHRGVEQVFFGVCEDQVDQLDQLLGLGFVPTGTRRRSELDSDFDEVELVCMLSGVAYDSVLHPTSGSRPATSPGEYRYRVV